MKKYFICILLFCFIPTRLLGDVVLTDKEAEFLQKTLQENKRVILLYNTRYAKLRKETPKISYEISEDKTIVQTIVIPVYQDNPLEYKVQFKITDSLLEPEKTFPLRLLLYSGVEYCNSDLYIDIKGGVKLLSLSSVIYTFLQPFGLNVLVGGRSIGVSISYTFPQLFKGTSLHIYSGFNYLQMSKSFGLGLSLYF